MKKLLFLFIISMCQLAMSAQETYTATYATGTHTLSLESSVMGDFQVWFWDYSDHGGGYFAYNGSYPGDHMTYVGETTSGTFVYKYKITKVSDVPTTFNLVRNGSDVRNNVAVSDISQTADPTFAMKSNKGRNVIYEMNIGMMTAEGSIAAAQGKLTGLKDLGVDVVWLMPIYERGTTGINSPYAAKDFEAVKESYGSVADLTAFVAEAHRLGMEVWMDWVPNHTATDHLWVTSHPEYYTKDGSGNMIHPNNYSDVFELNYSNPDLCAEMTRIMKQWVTTCDVDGFRNDYVSSKTIPASYWTQCIRELKQLKPSLKMMAEADLTGSGNKHLKDCGWDYDFAMELQGQMRTVGSGNDASALKGALKTFNYNNAETTFGRMTYVTNHDVNGNNDGGTLSTLYGDNRYAMTVFSFTIDGMPLIYNGQEIGDLAKLDYFQDGTHIDWTNTDATMQALVSKLAELKHEQLPLGNSPGMATSTSTLMTDQSSVLAYVRSIGNEAVLTVLNLGASDVNVKVTDLSDGTYTQVIKGGVGSVNTTATEVNLTKDQTISLQAHGYAVYVLKTAANKYLEKAPTIIYARDVNPSSPIEPVTLYAWYDEAGITQNPFGSWETARDNPSYTRWQDGAGNVWMRYVISEAPVGNNSVNVIAVAGGVQTDNLAVNGGTKNNFVTINSADGTKGDGHYTTATTGTLSNSEIAALTPMKRKVRVFVQDAYNEVPHLYVYYTDENGVKVEPQGTWAKAITLSNYTTYTSTYVSGNTADWYCYTIEVPDGQAFHAIPYSNGTQGADEYIGPSVTEYYIMKDGTETTQSGALSTTDANKFKLKAGTKDIDVYVRDESGAIVRLYAKYQTADGSFEYEPLGDKQSAFNTNLEVCLSDANNSDGQKIWYHRKFRDVNSKYKVSIIAYANYRQAPEVTQGETADTDNFYVVSESTEGDNKTVYLVIKTKPSDEATTVTEKTYSSIILTPQKTKDYTIYVRKDNPTAAEQDAGEYLLNLYSWYTIEGNLGVFEPSAMYPGTQLKERYIDETGQIWYCIHLNGIPFELYDGTPNSTLMAIVNQNGDDDKSQDFNITEATGNDGHEAYLVYHGLGEALTVAEAPGRLDDYPEAEGGGTYYLVSPELTANAKLPQFRFTPSRNRSMSGQDGKVNTLIHTLNIKDDEIVKRLSSLNSTGTTIHYRIVRGDGNTNFNFQPRTSGRNNYELGSGSSATTKYNGTGGTGYTYEKYPYRFGQGTAYNFKLEQGTAKSYTFFIESTSTEASSLEICMNKSIAEDNNGYYLIGNIDNSIEGASWSPANSNARMLMVRNEYKNPNDVAVTDSIVYTVTVPRPANGWGALYLAVSPASRLADNAWTVDDWGYVLRPQVQFQKDAIATEGGLFAHGEGQDSGDQSFNPSRFSDDYQSFTFSVNVTTSTYRFVLNRGLFIIGDAISEKIDATKDEWDPSNAHVMSYNQEGKYWFVENLPLKQGKLRFANDRLMTSCFIENDYRPQTPGTADGKKGPENGREETQHVNIVKWRNEGVSEHKDLTNSQKADDVDFLLPAGTYNIRFYIRSKVDNVGSGKSGNVSNDEYYCFYVIDPITDFVGISSTVNILNPVYNANNEQYTFFKPFSSYHAINRPEGVDIYYIKTLNTEDKTVMLAPFDGDVIPRNTGVILASAAEQQAGVTRLRVNMTTNDDPWEEADALEGNLLKPLLVGRKLEPKEDGKFNYIFGYKKIESTDAGVTLGYFKPGAGTAQSNSSYLQIADDLFYGTNEAPLFRLVMWNDTTTDLMPLPVETPETASDDYYTLSGMKLKGRPNERGIYIYKGKKITIR